MKPLVNFAILLFFFASCKEAPVEQFTDVSQASGITFSNIITETEAQNIFTYEYMYNGAGVAVGDVNNDGLPDIFFTANQITDELYLNKGNLTFENITTAAQVAGKPGWKTGVSMADVNADGLLDVYVCYSGNGDAASRSNQLFINKGIQNGKPLFMDEAKQYGLDAPGTNSSQSLFFDYDHDGDLDMFLLNHAVIFYAPLVNTYKLRHKRHPYYSNYLFRNDSGHFSDVSVEAGIAGGGNNFGLGVVAADINNDGWEDLYMTNDYEEQDFLLLNNKDGTFSEVTKQSLKHISKYGMGCDVADYNNDGRLDIIVPDMFPEDNYRQKVLRGPDEYDKYNLLIDSGYMHQNMRNTLQLNTGLSNNHVPQFSEIGQLAGISNTDWSWASLLADLDDDGYKDLYISNGFWRDYSNMDFQTYDVADYVNKNGKDAPLTTLIESMPQTKLSNYAFRNKGDLSFENVTVNWGLHKPAVSNGVAYADLDNDGDLDLIVNNMGEQASVYRNNNLAHNNYLNIRLKGANGNAGAIGSHVKIEYNNSKQQVAEMQTVRGYLSSMQPMIHFGLGKDTVINTLIVRWSADEYTTLKNVQANQTILIDRTLSEVEHIKANVDSMHAFIDFSVQSGIDFFQSENTYVDFKQESLLPWQLSKQGPKMCKADVNGDGLEDVFIGAPKREKAFLYLQQGGGKFRPSPSQPWQNDNTCDDVQSIFFDADGDNDIDLYIASGGNEMPDIGLYLDRLYKNDGKGSFIRLKEALPVMNASKGCVAVQDFNKDGKPDLFIGGRVVPGKYGISPQSFLLQNETVNGVIKFVDVTAKVASSLQYAGMVTSAIFTDLNKDSFPDLVIAGEWMPVKIFINGKDKFIERSDEFGLQNSNGLWTCIVPEDIDNDGDQDFLLGTLAPNTQFRASEKEPMTLCINDFLHTGKTASLLCYHIQNESYPYASRNELLEEMPALKKKFFYFKDYAKARLPDIFSPEQMKGMTELKVNQLKNCWLENINGKLVLHELPPLAQFSVIQGAVLVGAKNDNKKEILAAGNFFPFRVQLGREDAGKGVLLQWDSSQQKLVATLPDTNVAIDGDVRDIIEVKTSENRQLMIISKNNDHVQVLVN